VLRYRAHESGSAVVGSIFAIVFLMILVLGVVQVALSLYARNAVSSAAHEGARRALELGASGDDARALAARTARDSVGALVRDLGVTSTVREEEGRAVVYVRITGVVQPLGPVPIPIPIDARASVSREARP
jgi:Flp pilus assembly protein TadG